MAVDVLQFNSTKDVLRHEFVRRRQRNPSYTLRAYARDLTVAPSRLSEVMNGKSTFSKLNCRIVARRLGLTQPEQQAFLCFNDREHPRSAKIRAQAEGRLQRLKTQAAPVSIDTDRFALIADWYHMAILELLRLDNFKSSVPWIAARLGLGEVEVDSAIGRLKRLNLVEETAAGLRAVVTQTATRCGEYPSQAINHAHEQYMGKGAAALHVTPLDEREFGSLILSVDKSRLAEAKKMIRDFRQAFNRKMDTGPAKDRVYCLAVQFFPLDKE